MSVTTGEVVNAVLASLSSDVGPDLVAGWVSERYRELTNRSRFRHLMKTGELVLSAVITTGTATATQISDIIVGNAAARTAWAADIIGRYIRIDGRRNWHRVTGRTPSGDLMLESPFTEATGSAVAYKLVARFHRLPENLRHLGIVCHPRLDKPLDTIDPQELDESMVSRVLVADLPSFIAERGSDEDGRKLIEVYPFTRTDQLVWFTYWERAPELLFKTVLPPEIDLHVLKAGALIDLYRYETARALRANQAEAAAVWTNLMNQQSTRWEDKIKEAVKQDRATNTISMQLNTAGFPQNGRSIRNARDMVYARGNRP